MGDPEPRSPSAVPLELLDDLRDLRLSLGHGQGNAAGSGMSAAAEARRQLAHVRLAAPPEDAVPEGYGRNAFTGPPC